MELDLVTVRRDIDAILWSMNLYKIRRFSRQRYWEIESQDADYAARVEPFPRLESVAEHSWHVADTVLLIGPHFSVNVDHCVKLAILHDKMEIVTGDKNPVGKDGTGQKTHAFNIAKRYEKELSEKSAIHNYLSRLSANSRIEQERCLLELLSGTTLEARFVKAIDKLQAFAFVLMKKKGLFQDKHLLFTLKYTYKAVEYFPDLNLHYQEIRSRLLLQVARRRGISIKKIEISLLEEQMSLFQ